MLWYCCHKGQRTAAIMRVFVRATITSSVLWISIVLLCGAFMSYVFDSEHWVENCQKLHWTTLLRFWVVCVFTSHVTSLINIGLVCSFEKARETWGTIKWKMFFCICGSHPSTRWSWNPENAICFAKVLFGWAPKNILILRFSRKKHVPSLYWWCV